MKKTFNLRIYTSFVSPTTLELFVEKDMLPLFALRSIANSTLIGKYSETPIHLKELSPSTEIFRARRDGLITQEEYQRRYALEISKLDIRKILRKLELLQELSGANGVVILGYGSSYDVCHRKVLADIFNNSGLLKERVEEILIS